ncbi:MAG: H+-transporting ATPase [Euryarchaeota archaeon]|nr:H+-transporting ATPase [Euryarchaeota archaeon]
MAGQKSPTEEYIEISIEEAIKRLSADLKTGLSMESVKERIRRTGYNEVPEKKQNSLLNFLKRFWGLTPWMLEITIALSYFLGRYVDLVVIAFLLFMNAVLSFFQEQQSSRAVESLKRKLNVKAKVLRDGNWSTIESRNLVPGDIVRVRKGDFVPADVKIIDENTEVDQSALTGESFAVEKTKEDILYSGSIIRKGEATGVVVSTGVQTYFGRTAQLVHIARPRMYVEEVITNLLKWLLSLVVVLLAVAFVISYIRGINLVEILPLALILLVSSIPVALPTMFTVTMALGSLELAKKGVLVTRLNASQDASMMDILCIDKTGTITLNQLSVADITAMDGYTKGDVVLYGALASSEANQDPIDIAFIAAAKQKELDTGEYDQISFTPFDPSSRRTESIVQKNNERIQVAKGAVTTLAALCGYDAGRISILETKIGEYAEKGYRTLAVAVERSGSRMELIGMAALYDAPRPESAKLIAELKELGITTKMLTGDSLSVANEIAKEAGIEGRIIRIAELKEIESSATKKATQVSEQSGGFAEIYPEDKYLIVKDFQKKAHIVGMTGDGVNDAPALRQAEVGIAVSNATDIAKGAASVVLTHEGLTEIVELVKTGRQIHQRISTWILNKIIKTFEIVLFVVLAFLITGEYVIGAFEIVLLLFLIDFVTIAIATDNVRPARKPESWNIAAMARVAVLLGMLIVAESFGLLYIGMSHLRLTSHTGLHTFVFDMLIFGGMFTILVVREKGYFWKSIPSKTLMAAISGDLVVTYIISTLGIPGLMPIPAGYVLLAMAWYFVWSFVVNDMFKVSILERFKADHRYQ